MAGSSRGQTVHLKRPARRLELRDLWRGLRCSLISEATARIGLTGHIDRWLTRELFEECVFNCHKTGDIYLYILLVGGIGHGLRM